LNLSNNVATVEEARDKIKRERERERERFVEAKWKKVEGLLGCALREQFKRSSPAATAT
jgi:hypothetical protein